MRLRHTVIALLLVAALSAQAAGQDKGPDTRPAKAADPMAGFARLVGGEWRVKFENGTTGFQTWHWGPGKHSLRKVTEEFDAFGTWAGEVLYWHPGRKQVCLLGMHPDIPGIGRGVSDGTIKFEGETAVAAFDLYQPRGRRTMGMRMTFHGTDKYREALLEATGPDGLKPLAEWEFVRIKDRPAPKPRTDEKEQPKFPKHLKAFEPLLGRTWEAKGNSAAGDAFHIHSTYQWVPSLEVVSARVVAPVKDGEPTHRLDAYFYHHVGTNKPRCLALSNRGGVYEGDLTVLDAGALQLDLKGHEGDRFVPYLVRLDFEKDGTVRQRIWSVQGTERTLVLDAHHKKLEAKKD